MAFRARFTGGNCSSCGKGIVKGQEITWARKGDKKLRHITCGESFQPICTVCMDVRTSNASGICTACTNKKTETNEASSSETKENHSPRHEQWGLCDKCGNFSCTCNEEEEIKTQAEAAGMFEHEAQAEAKRATNGNDKSTASDNALLDLMAQALKPRLDGQLTAKLDKLLDPEKLEKTISEKIEALRDSMATKVIIENKETGEIKDCGLQHKDFPTLLKMLQARDHKGNRLNIWVAGPAGTGKTSAAENASLALGQKFYMTGALTESYKLFGYISVGTGEYVRTPFREAWEFGGTFLWDDCDGSDPNVLVEFNAPLANGVCPFPDGMVKRHPDCCIVLTANTWGLGATNDYVGRFKQDAAFLDRFVKIFWDIDESLELETAPDTRWTKRVQAIRRRVKDKGIKVLVTPRASYYGAALLATGLSWDQVEAATLKGAMSAEQWASLQ